MYVLMCVCVLYCYFSYSHRSLKLLPHYEGHMFFVWFYIDCNKSYWPSCWVFIAAAVFIFILLLLGPRPFFFWGIFTLLGFLNWFLVIAGFVFPLPFHLLYIIYKAWHLKFFVFLLLIKFNIIQKYSMLS